LVEKVIHHHKRYETFYSQEIKLADSQAVEDRELREKLIMQFLGKRAVKLHQKILAYFASGIIS